MRRARSTTRGGCGVSGALRASPWVIAVVWMLAVGLPAGAPPGQLPLRERDGRACGPHTSTATGREHGRTGVVRHSGRDLVATARAMRGAGRCPGAGVGRSGCAGAGDGWTWLV